MSTAGQRTHHGIWLCTGHHGKDADSLGGREIGSEDNFVEYPKVIGWYGGWKLFATCKWEIVNLLLIL